MFRPSAADRGRKNLRFFFCAPRQSRVLDVREDIASLLDGIYQLQGAVEIISRRHFDGRPIVFSKKAARLGQALEMAEALASTTGSAATAAASASG